MVDEKGNEEAKRAWDAGQEKADAINSAILSEVVRLADVHDWVDWIKTRSPLDYAVAADVVRHVMIWSSNPIHDPLHGKVVAVEFQEKSASVWRIEQFVDEVLLENPVLLVVLQDDKNRVNVGILDGVDCPQGDSAPPASIILYKADDTLESVPISQFRFVGFRLDPDQHEIARQYLRSAGVIRKAKETVIELLGRGQ